MDALEHTDGVWEIVYGPVIQPSSEAATSQAGSDARRPAPALAAGLGEVQHLGLRARPRSTPTSVRLYAQLILNQDGANTEPRIWITPPRQTVQTVDELAEAIAEALAPYQPVRMPA
jgi:hypothetical protein